MTRPSLHFLAAAFAIGTAVAPVHHDAGSDGKAPKVIHPQITAAAWFQPDPLCATPLGCGFIKLPALSPYPKGTFHIGTAVGRQIARAFIAVNLGKQGSDIRGGTLSVPLDTSPTDGSLNPQAAKVNVCVTYQAVTDVEGAFDGAPAANCLPAAPAKYVAKPAPHLVANLERLASGLSGGGLSGVKGFALLPADAAPTTAWQLVFKLPTTKSAPGPTLSLLVGKVRHVTATPPAGHHGDGHEPGNLPAPVVGTGVAPAPTLPPATTVVPPDNTKPVIANPSTPVGRFVTVGYQYPEVWLLPLLLLVLIPYALRSLTKDLTRKR